MSKAQFAFTSCSVLLVLRINMYHLKRYRMSKNKLSKPIRHAAAAEGSEARTHWGGGRSGAHAFERPVQLLCNLGLDRGPGIGGFTLGQSRKLAPN